MTIDTRVSRQRATLRSVYAVRGFLVLVLVAFQSLEVSDSFVRVAGTGLWVMPVWSVAALFALAGFTAMRGVERRGISGITMRAVTRYLPALVLVVVVTAYAIGVAVTTEPRQSYLIDGNVVSYLLNIFGIVRFTLPGVFEFNASAGEVNPTLWLVPVGYAAAVILVVTTLRARWTTVLLAAIGLVLAAAGVGLDLADVDLGNADGVLSLLLVGKGLCALVSFIAGAFMYRVRRSVPIDWRAAVVFALLALVVAAVSDPSWSSVPLLNAGIAIPLAYLAIYASSWPWPFRRLAPRIAPLLWRILLLSYPIQQLVIALGPDRQNVVVNLSLSLPIILALSGAEWFLLERPLLRRFFPALLPADPESAPGRWPDARGYVQQARATLPLLVGAVLVIFLMLAALAITMFAMQRDAGGV
ncbi:hypothetical protein U1872_00745 [Sphingomonas sp. RB3P16]|uniref:hypothetical protein n=1 Tax=Parasphingomonas frigoris TaxID=3096163 RepID=UPI002FCA45C5